MIYETKDTARENEVKVYTVAVGMLPRTRKEMKQSAKALEVIKGLPGFIGVHPMGERGTLLLFDTLNNAKVGKNILDSYTILTGYNICECFIDKSYLPEGK